MSLTILVAVPDLSDIKGTPIASYSPDIDQGFVIIVVLPACVVLQLFDPQRLEQPVA